MGRERGIVERRPVALDVWTKVSSFPPIAWRKSVTALTETNPERRTERRLRTPSGKPPVRRGLNPSPLSTAMPHPSKAPPRSKTLCSKAGKAAYQVKL
ncbi:hypothetical protein FS837_011933 [Tulasnella sp. UAMH 9824]|nr:hypothetical protein FS837_011933 [Tulasnella sp. UAMH 9824]